MTIAIEKAKTEHLEAVEILIRLYAKQDLLLPRSYDNLLGKKIEFSVATCDDKVVGCVALAREYDGLGEIRSLAVDPAYEGRGIGGMFIDTCEREASELGFSKIFALTYIPDFFIKRSYSIVDKETLPQKIWNHCWKCSKFFDCKEIAVVKPVNPRV